MSEQQNWVELPRGNDAAFATLMDTLVAEDEGAASAEAPAAGADQGDAAAGEAARAQPVGDGGGVPAGAPAEPAAVPGTGADTGADAGAAAGADGAGDRGAEPAGDAGPGGGDQPPAGAADAATLIAQIGGLSEAFETSTREAFQTQALTEVREEFKGYFDALKKHPRLLVGEQVPALNGPDGAMETLRDAADAKEWQEAVKGLLVEEIQDRASRSMEASSGIINTVHASIELFTRNPDLIPNTKQFDRTLADRFAALAKPYELRVEGKLHGYTIPVQPLVEQLRGQLAAERAAKGPTTATPVKPAAPTPDPPQMGIQSKAGSGTEAEDFSTLFGTLGLPNLRF